MLMFKGTKRFFSLLLVFALLLSFVPAALSAEDAAQFSIVQMKTDFLDNPIGLDSAAPLFSWQMESDVRGAAQSAYQIVVKNSDGVVCWDSGKVGSNASFSIAYAGAALVPSTRYSWIVTVWNEAGVSVKSGEANFETGLMNAGWSGAAFIKATGKKQGEPPDPPAPPPIVNYTIDMDFNIESGAAGPCFAVKDTANFFMWQINIRHDNQPDGAVLLRKHYWRNGNVACFSEPRIDDKVLIKAGEVHHLKLDIQGKVVRTYIDNILVDTTNNPFNEDFGYYGLGFRADRSGAGVYERAYYDNIKMETTENGSPKTLFATDFSDVNNVAFAGGTIVGGAYYVARQTTDGTIYARQRKSYNNGLHFKLDMDVTLVSDNAGIIFGGKDIRNMYMWSINAHDYTDLYLRRHYYVNDSPGTANINLGGLVSKAEVLNKEVHLTIEVVEDTVKTWLAGKLVDTYVDSTGNLVDGLIGFRQYVDSGVNEIAMYDNIVYTSYKKNDQGGEDPTVEVNATFDDGKNPFDGGTVTTVDGNKKLYIASRGGDTRVTLESNVGIPMFRKKFVTDAGVKSARLYCTGLGIYDVSINGARVGHKNADGTTTYDELKPGWTDYNKTVFYNTYDVTELLRAEENAIGAEVASGWWNGNITRGTYGAQNLGFMAKLLITYLDGSTKTIVTDTSWLCAVDGPVRASDIYQGEKYDAQREKAGWTQPGYDDSAWLQTAVNTEFKGTVKTQVGQTVQVRPELMRLPKTLTVYEGTVNTGTTYGAIKKVSELTGPQPVTLNPDQNLVIDFGQNMVGWMEITMRGQAGDKVTWDFGEMLNDNGAASRGNDGPAGSIYTANYRAALSEGSYVLKGTPDGETHHPRFTFYGFRYCELKVNAPVEILSVKGQVVGSVMPENSSFETSDASVNQLYSNVVWGQRGNFVSIPTDCPQRDERLGWTGDTEMFSRAATYNADTLGFYHKWMGDMRDSQNASGAYPDVAPANSAVGFGNGAWSDAGVIVPWHVYLMYGDRSIIAENYAFMEKYMNWMAGNAGGGYQYNGSGTAYGDWLSYEGTDSRYISVAYYAYDALLMAKMSKALSVAAGDDYDKKAAAYQTLYGNIKTEFAARYVNADGTLKQTSQTAYLLALKLDLFPGAAATQNARQYLTGKIAGNNNTLSTGFVGTGILNQTLAEFGAQTTAYNLLQQRNDPSWLYSVDQGATTIWERWNSYTIANGFGPVGMNSFNHYAYGAVSEWMYRFMAGIEADENVPGFKHFVLQPMPDMRKTLPAGQQNITWVKSGYGSYYGRIESAWKREGCAIMYTFKVPANTSATLYLPVRAGDNVTASDGLTKVRDTIHNGIAVAQYELTAGTYAFVVSPDKTALLAAISDAETRDQGKYVDYSGIAPVLAAAKLVAADDFALQAEIDAAAKALNDALDALILKATILKFQTTVVTVKRGRTLMLPLAHNGKYPLIFTSINTAIGTVDSQGVVTGVKAGLTAIMVKTTDGSNLTSQIVVSVIA